MKLKITLFAVLTLVLGFIIGILVSAKLRHNRLRPVRTFVSERYFKEHLYRVIDPDSGQIEKLDNIIREYGKDFHTLSSDYRQSIDSLMDMQWKEIRPVLSRDQVKRLEEMEEKRREAMKEFRNQKRMDPDKRFDRSRDRDDDRRYRDDDSRDRDDDRRYRDDDSRDRDDDRRYRDDDRRYKDDDRHYRDDDSRYKDDGDRNEDYCYRNDDRRDRDDDNRDRNDDHRDFDRF